MYVSEKQPAKIARNDRNLTKRTSELHERAVNSKKRSHCHLFLRRIRKGFNFCWRTKTIVEPKSALKKTDFWGRCRILPAFCRLFASLLIRSQMSVKLYRWNLVATAFLPAAWWGVNWMWNLRKNLSWSARKIMAALLFAFSPNSVVSNLFHAASSDPFCNPI